MPSTNDFKKSKKNKSSSKVEKLHSDFPEAQVNTESEPRPQFTAESTRVSEAEAQIEISEVKIESEIHEEKNTAEAEAFQFQFVGSDVLRSRAPKAVEFAEKVTGDWLKDGDFSELPISQPLVQFYLGEGLRKAKSVEKQILAKVESSNVVPVAKMLAESLIQKITKK